MKTRKHNLSAIAVGVALSMGSMSALAVAFTPGVPNPAAAGAQQIIRGELASVPPTFNSNERVGLCLIESVVSTLAARTNDFSCDTKSYTLSVVTTDPKHGYADIDGGVDIGGTTLNASLSTKDIGAKCKVDQAEGLNLLNGLELVEYDGKHGWSRSNEIFNSDAYIKIRDRQTGSDNWYREVDIKDYFKQVIAGRSWEFDWGLEDIKKFRDSYTRNAEGLQVSNGGFYYPVSKWQELSWYKHENGEEGGLWLRKQLVIPRSAFGCEIRVIAEDVFNGSGEFEVTGNVTVGVRAVAAAPVAP